MKAKQPIEHKAGDIVKPRQRALRKAGVEIVYRPVADLHPNPKNPRKATPEAIANLAESIKGNPGYFEMRPVIVSDRTGELVIIDGEQRTKAAKLLGWDVVPTILKGGLTEAQEDEILIKGNTHAGIWDEKKLKAWEKEQLQTWGVVAWKPTKEEKYTRKIESPIYVPKGDKPEVGELYDDAKTQELQERIAAAKVPPEVKKFLMAAATRHIVFNFEKIAEYYAQSSKAVQKLFEDSALVIIDFNDAIGGGYVKMCESLVEQYKAENDD